MSQVLDMEISVNSSQNGDLLAFGRKTIESVRLLKPQPYSHPILYLVLT
jgi:hypothetical protein